MDQYCVVLCGLRAEATEETAVWPPVAAALKLDQTDFDRRVVAALPRIVRQHLNRATAERIVELLQAMHVDARALPDEGQLVYIQRAQATCGPLPLTALGDFIEPGEAYRLSGSTSWLPWPAPLDESSASPSLATFGLDAVEEAPADDEVAESPQTVPAADAAGLGTDEPVSALADLPDATAESDPSRALPPPLPTSSVLAEHTPDPAEDPHFAESTAADEASSDTPEDPDEETPTPDGTEVDAPITAETDEAAPPPRSRKGRLLVLVVLAALAYWAWGHWGNNASVESPPPPPAATGPTAPVPAASTAAAPQPASSTANVPAAAASSTTASMPEPAASAPAPASSGALAAPASVAPPASASSVAPAPAASASAASAAASSTAAAAKASH
ncbi:MAG TPA: hypothetical protein VIL60_03160 [Rhodanobacter sp.]